MRDMRKILQFAKRNKAEVALLMLIFLSAAVLRLYNLEWEALAWNEGTLLGGSKEYVSGNFLYNFGDFAAPPMLKYLGAVALYMFGFSEFWLRAIGVIFGLGTVLLTYLIGRRYYDRNIALFAAAIVGFSMIHINFSRTFLTEPVLGFFFTASFYAYLRVAKDGETRKWPVILGIAAACALLSKWIGINLLVAIAVHALYSRHLRIHLRKKFAIEAESWLFKAFLVFLIAFFVIWPMALYPIKLDVSVSVVGMEDHGDTFILNVPTILLSPQEYLTVALGREEKIAPGQILPIMWVPLLGYTLLMFSKESLLFAALFIAGLAAMYKARRKIDKDILIFLGVFLLILWLQRYGQTYRYLTVIMPLAAIVAARSMGLVKKANLRIAAIVLFSAVLLGTAIAVHPNYNVHYNFVEAPFGFMQVDQEIWNTDGFREGIEYVKANCRAVTGNMAGTLINYVGDPSSFIVPDPTESDLPICAYVSTEFEARTGFIGELERKLDAECTLEKEITRGGSHLRSIYSCA